MKKEINVLKIVLWIVAIIAFMGLAVYGANSFVKAEEAKAAFQANMAAAAANTDPGSVTGSKAIAEVHRDDEVEYTTSYVPEEYRTEDHTQIRYVIKREEGPGRARSGSADDGSEGCQNPGE